MKNLNFRKVLLAVIDAVIITLAGFLANYIVNAFGISARYSFHAVMGPNLLGIPYMVASIVLTNLLCVGILWFSGAYNKTWKYLKIKDYFTCGIAVILGMVISDFLLVLLRYSSLGYAVVYSAICTGFSLFGVIFFREIFKQAFNLTTYDVEPNKQRTLIVGAGETCRILLQEMEHAKTESNNPFNEYLPVVIVDDNESLIHSQIDKVPVKGTTKDIINICEKENIQTILFAIPSCNEEKKGKILQDCSKTRCKLKVIPSLAELIEDNETKILSQARDVNFEDLLGRDPISFDREAVASFIKGKKCMVTGGGGSIGSELVRQLAQYNPKQIIILDIYENNAYDIQQELLLDYPSLEVITLIASVRDYNKMDIIFNEYRPNIVFHAAAHKHVPLMETSPEEAVKNNIFGTFNVATLAEFYEVEKFVMISTDKAVNPTSIMGATKRCCEMIIQYKSMYATKTDFVTTRFGNVLGSNGSVIPLFRRQIEAGKPLTVTHPEMIRYFMTIPEAVSLVMQAASMAYGGEIFVMDMGAPVKIVSLAENLCRMYGKVPYKDVPIVFTGLRPGEKLYEELLMDEEGLKETANKKIFIGKQIDINEDTLINELASLEECVRANDSEKTVEMLEKIVPTFNHKTNIEN